MKATALITNLTLNNSNVYVIHPDAEFIWKTFPPVLLCCGTVGSIISLMVLTQKSMQRSPMTSYLVLIAIIDMLVLYTGLLRQWIKYYFGLEIRSLHVIICKMHPWMVYLALDMSAWLLVCMTLERVVSVWKPHKVKVICTSKLAYILIVIVVVVLMVINSHFLYGKEIVETVKENVTVTTCTQMNEFYRDFLYHVFPWVDLCMFSLIPFSIQITGNGFIIGKIVINSRSMKRSLKNEIEKQTRRRQVSSMTVMLLTLNCVFLLCTSPVSVFLVLRGYWKIQNIDYKSRRTDLLWACTTCLMYVNNSFNFIFYCLSGRRFRTELKHMFRGFPSRSSIPETFTLSRNDSSFQVDSIDGNMNGTYTLRF